MKQHANIKYYSPAMLTSLYIVELSASIMQAITEATVMGATLNSYGPE
jgi:hypothetical protein